MVSFEHKIKDFWAHTPKKDIWFFSNAHMYVHAGGTAESRTLEFGLPACRFSFSFGCSSCVMDRSDTRCHSSSTLARGVGLANKPIDELVNVKAEPDEEEQAMESEMQAGLHSHL